MNEEENDYELTIILNKISNEFKNGLISEDEFKSGKWMRKIIYPEYLVSYEKI